VFSHLELLTHGLRTLASWGPGTGWFHRRWWRRKRRPRFRVLNRDVSTGILLLYHLCVCCFCQMEWFYVVFSFKTIRDRSGPLGTKFPPQHKFPSKRKINSIVHGKGRKQIMACDRESGSRNPLADLPDFADRFEDEDPLYTLSRAAALYVQSLERPCATFVCVDGIVLSCTPPGGARRAIGSMRSSAFSPPSRSTNNKNG